ncbi:metalloreductase STEAP3 [Procambarus clarkii]|uniref:metalloreductase STEAP3 n=1 Tax=Procambarus clarkii TaxID=6728 RepID=UPI003742E33C
MEMKTQALTQDTNIVTSQEAESVLHHHHVSDSALDHDGQKPQQEQSSSSSSSRVEERRVVLVGSGDMTRSLVGCLVRAGYHPLVATRNPARAKSWAGDEVEVCGVEDGVGRGDLVVVAIPPQHHHSLPRHLLHNKIVVDISNRSPDDPSDGPSMAEKLQELLPEAQVVKALNTMSAYVLQRRDLYAGRQVPVCGGTTPARTRVMALVRDMGLAPVDMGGLKNARALEDIPLSFFPEWKLAAIVTGIIFVLFWLLQLFRIQICPNLTSAAPWNWQRFHRLPFKNTEVTLAFTGCLLLLLCYIPGMMAAYLQLWRGTKYSQFPDWLDAWLKARKQLGLLALLLGATHGCMAIFVQVSKGMEDVWWQHTYLATGALLTAAMAILGITTLPSVSASLTWREFSVVQRYLGWASVVLVTLHLTCETFRGLLRPLSCVVLPSGSQIMVPLCFLTLLFKIPLLVPCVDSYLAKIRAGYERHAGRQATDLPSKELLIA